MSSVTVFTASHEGLAVICEATDKFKARPCDPLVLEAGRVCGGSPREEFVYEVSVEDEVLEAVRAALENARAGRILATEQPTKRFKIGSTRAPADVELLIRKLPPDQPGPEPIVTYADAAKATRHD